MKNKENLIKSIFKSRTIFKIFKIPVNIHPSWYILFILFTFIIYYDYTSLIFESKSIIKEILLSATIVIMVFFSLLAHELGHSLVGMRYGIKVNSIVLFIFGGIAQIATEPPSPKAEVLMSIAGPIVSLIVSAASGLFYLLFSFFEFEWLGSLFFALSSINLGLALFNLLPAFPMDGGRIVRAIIWKKRKNLIFATKYAYISGRIFSFLLLIIGIVVLFKENYQGLWFILLGLFLDRIAIFSYKNTLIHQKRYNSEINPEERMQ